jgi:hypothetical protein
MDSKAVLTQKLATVSKKYANKPLQDSLHYNHMKETSEPVPVTARLESSKNEQVNYSHFEKMYTLLSFVICVLITIIFALLISKLK